MGQGGRLHPQEASVAALAPRPAVPLRGQEEEEVGIARFGVSLTSPPCPSPAS